MKKTSTTTAVLKDGTGRLEEYEFRPIDRNGDVIDPEHCDTLEEAKTLTVDAIGSFDGECVAWVIEKHVSYYPAHRAPRGQDPDVYTTIETGGDSDALKAGGWLT
jgi:hypothetical protein